MFYSFLSGNDIFRNSTLKCSTQILKEFGSNPEFIAEAGKKILAAGVCGTARVGRSVGSHCAA
jgi:hypothetical protein